MSSLLLRLSFLAAATAFLSHSFNSRVPEPYLDEAFHIPQARRYCERRFREWDDKITTPFGLYVLSYLYTRPFELAASLVGNGHHVAAVCSVPVLRLINAIGVAFAIPALALSISRNYGRSDGKAAGDALGIGFFPLIFFFGGLFYTDVWSTVFILAAYIAVLNGNNWVAGISSAISITFRQTNVLWTIFFCIIALQKQGKRTNSKREKHYEESLRCGSSWQQITEASLKRGELYDPPFAEAGISDIPKSVASLALRALRDPVQTLILALPYASVVAGFIAFVIWNGGIVLGDKTAHVPMIHIPQLFYFAVFTLFMSWPLIISHKLPLRFLRDNFPIFPFLKVNQSSASKLVKTLRSIGMITVMLLVVHKNTVLHPYLLADNRHYPFYLFRRTILRHRYVRYLAVPIYFGAGWTVLDRLRMAGRKVSLLWTLGWVGAVSGSIVGAGLVEFRYFIGGWVLWRLAISSDDGGYGDDSVDSGVGDEQESGKTPKDRAQSWGWRYWLEMAWFAAINFCTAYMFLNKGFAWENEPGKIQRFMW